MDLNEVQSFNKQSWRDAGIDYDTGKGGYYIKEPTAYETYLDRQVGALNKRFGQGKTVAGWYKTNDKDYFGSGEIKKLRIGPDEKHTIDDKNRIDEIKSRNIYQRQSDNKAQHPPVSSTSSSSSSSSGQIGGYSELLGGVDFSKYSFHTGLAIAIVIIVIMLVIFMPKQKCFYDINAYPPLRSIGNDYPEVVAQANKVDGLTAQDATGVSAVRVTPECCSMYGLLSKLPGFMCASVAQIDPGCKTKGLAGSKEIANYSLRICVPVTDIERNKVCIDVDGQTKYLEPHTPILYDNSKPTTFYNYQKSQPIRLLLIDIYGRPKMGTSSISHGLLI